MKNRQFNLCEQTVLEEIMQARRDVRGNHFLAKAVAPEVLSKILQAASWAPSVGFSQPWEFVMVQDPQIRQTLVANFKAVNSQAEAQFSDEKQGLYHQLKLEGILEAPVNIAVFYRPSEQPVLGQSSMPETGRYSVVCAIQNMWLMARAMNIGLGWVSILTPDVVKKSLKAPKSAEFVAYLCLGYTDEFLDKPELELRKWEQRKVLESAIYYDTY